MQQKVSIIGAGNVGAACALWIHSLNVANIVLVDIIEGPPVGKSLDLIQSSPLLGVDFSVVGDTEYERTKDSDIVIITAGVPRKEGVSRDALLETNVKIVKEIAIKAARFSPNCIFIVASNPLDAMVYTVSKACPLHPKSKILGMAGVLDSARLQSLVAGELGVSVEDVTAMVLGGHGDSMVPLIRFCTVSGIPIKNLISASKIEELIKKTKTAGGDFVQYLNTTAWVTPGLAISKMVEAILKNKGRLMACSAYLNGQYGYSDIFIGVPVKLGEFGVEQIYEIELMDDEKLLFANTVEHVKALAVNANQYL